VGSIPPGSTISFPYLAFMMQQEIVIYFDYSGNTVDEHQAFGHHGHMKLDDAAARLEALGNPTRLKIFRALVRAGDQGMAVGHLQTMLDIAPSTLSHHIKSMLIVGLIAQERQSTTLICRANYEVMRCLLDFLLEECCVGSGCAGSKTTPVQR
jgi:ArsR family transcriptional regulator, arsenate/arsenite/antimonite-responsive transcriptional repressor